MVVKFEEVGSVTNFEEDIKIEEDDSAGRRRGTENAVHGMTLSWSIEERDSRVE